MAVDKPDKTRTRAGPTAAHEKSREGQSAVAGGDLKDFDEDGGSGALALAAAREIERQLGGALKPGLYLVATPIGNLGDMTLRGLAVLAACDVIYCEDTRHSRTLMQHYEESLRSYTYLTDE